MRKKLLLLTASIAAGVLLTMGMSLAYYTDTEIATNVVTMGNVDIQLTEEVPSLGAGQDWIVEEAKDEDGNVTGLAYANILPGATVTKEPVVTNTGANSAYIRAKVTITVTGADGKTTLDEKGITLVGADIDGEGYIYVDHIVNPNETVTLFNEFKIPTTWGNQYANANIEIKVVAEAVQSDNITVTGTGIEATKSAFQGVKIEKYK